MKKILITGISGFIGSNLFRRLSEKGYEVIGLDRSQGNDIRSKDIYPAFEGVDTVFHLAAKNDILACQKDPVETIDINVNGTVNVFEAARRAGVKKVVFASSSVLEEGEARLKGFYAISKTACENIAQGYQAAFGLDYVLLRYFNVYGAGQDYRRENPPVMSDFIIKALRGVPPTFYEGYERDGRDFIYVDDINDFHVMCIENENIKNNLFRLGTGKTSSIKEVWDTIQKISGSKLEPVVRPGPVGHMPVLTKADVSAAEGVGWHAKTSLEDGLRMQYENIKDAFAKGIIK